MKKIYSLIIAVCIMLTVTACSGGGGMAEPSGAGREAGDSEPVSAGEPGADSPVDDEFPPEELKNVETSKVKLPEDLCSPGDTVGFADIAAGESGDSPGMEFTLRSAAFYASLADSGLDISKCAYNTENYSADGSKMLWEPEKCGVLVCELTMKNLAYDNSARSICSLCLMCCDPDTGEVWALSRQPVWFSDSQGGPDSEDFWNYVLPKGESSEMSAAYLVGKDYDPANLYLCPDFGLGVGGQFFRLGL